MANGSLTNGDLPSVWHSIRPWRPTLSLSVREITSVSATFVLSSPLGTTDSSTDPLLKSLGLDIDVEDDRRNGNEVMQSNVEDVARSTQIISDVLSKGLSVKVNGTPWQRVLMKIDDISDEAIIILFGLMPGRQYDIELGIVPGENSIRGQITTSAYMSDLSHSLLIAYRSLCICYLFVVDAARPRSDTDSSQRSFSSSDSLSRQTSSPSTSSSLHSSPPLNPIQSSSSLSVTVHTSSPPPSFSLEDRKIQLTHKLNLLTSQQATLTADLKSARKESQKAEAALKAEIDALRKASEKNTQAETRARQKVLALQEAVRRTANATDEIKVKVEETEREIPELEKKRVEVEAEWERIKKQAECVEARRAEVEATEQRRVECLQAELAGLGNRMERLNVRKEKLEGEGGVISELEERLRRLEEERERVENDPFGYGYDTDDRRPEDRRGSVSSRPEDSSASPSQLPPRNRQSQGQQHHHSQSVNGQPRNSPHHHPRKRHSHPARQQQVQRPVGSGHAPRSSLPPGPGVIHLNVNLNAPKHSNISHHGRHKNPSPSSGSSLSTPPNATQAQPTVITNPPAPGAIAPQVTSSTLSSRAPAFEPSIRRPVRSGSINSIGTGGSAGSVTVKSDLNPGSSPFSPRSGAAIAVAQAAIAAGSTPPQVGGGKRSGSK